MFYQCPLSIEGKTVSAMVTLTPAESKRLIAKGVVRLPEVKEALTSGIVIIARGTTNAFVAEEIMGEVIEHKQEYSRGIIAGGELKVNLRRGGGHDFVLRNGKLWDIRPQEAILEFTEKDVFIKGASAIDATGEAAVLAAGTEWGTIGYSLPPVTARGANLIVPVGMEKMVPSVAEAVRQCSVFKYKYSTGSACSLAPMVNAKVVTEIQALGVLGGVNAVHVASGGIGSSEGSVVLVVTGGEPDLEEAFSLIKGIKGEPPVPCPEVTGETASSLNYDPQVIRETNRRR